MLPRSDWWRLWDHFITTGPSLVVPALMALLISLDQTMMACTNGLAELFALPTELPGALVTNMDHIVVSGPQHQTSTRAALSD